MNLLFDMPLRGAQIEIEITRVQPAEYDVGILKAYAEDWRAFLNGDPIDDLSDAERDVIQEAADAYADAAAWEGDE